MSIKKNHTNYRIAFCIVCFLNSIIYILISTGILGKVGAFCLFLAGVYGVLKK